MTDYVESRDAIVTYINSNFSGYPIFYENTTEVDLDTVSNCFVKVQIDYDGAYQASMGSTKVARVQGQVIFKVFAKQGTGTRNTLIVLETLQNLAISHTSAKVQFEFPTPGDKESRNGWESQEFVIPFWFNRFY